MRKTIVKHRYIRRSSGGHARAVAHVRYIQYRPGESEKRKFFDANRDEVTGGEVRCRLEWQNGSVVCHKLVFSPGVHGVDLHDYTRELMLALAEKKGLDLDWYSVEHHNTDHEHLHVVLMGTDKNGNAVRLDPKQDYAFLRFIGDRYIEHYHDLDRYLDRELAILMKRGFEHDRGDEAYERLLAALTSEKTIAELDEERRQRLSIALDEPDEPFSGGRQDKLFRQLLDDLKSKKPLEEIDRERKQEEKDRRERPEKEQREKEERRLRLIAEAPEEERIQAGGDKYFTKHHLLEELEEYDEALRDGSEKWLELEQYQLLWKWIGTKQTAGDDYYEREPREGGAKEDEKDDQFDDLHKIQPAANEHRRRLTFQQYTHETQGRLLDVHERMQIMHQRNELRKELAAMDEAGEENNERREEIQAQLKWLKECASDTPQPNPKAKQEEKEVDKTKEEESREDEKLPEDRAENERSSEESAGGKEEITGKDRDEDKEREKEAQERDQADSQNREEEQQRQDEEQQQRDRVEQERREEETQERERQEDQRLEDERQRDEEARIEEERREEDEWRRQKDEEERQRYEQETRDRQDQETREREQREALEREERDTREREERDHEELEARERDETKEREDRQHQERKEEAERNFRLQQELEKLRQQQLEPGGDGSRSSSRLQEKIEQYEQQLAGQKGERSTSDGIDDRYDPMERVQPEFDLDKNIEENWSLDEKASQDYELDSLLGDLDREEEREHSPAVPTDTNDMLFGDTAEQLPEYEKTEEEERMGEWEDRAFDPELIKEQQDRTDESEHELGDGEHSQEEREQDLDQQGQQREAEVAVQIMIERAFSPEHEEEHDRDDDDDRDHGDRDR